MLTIWLVLTVFFLLLEVCTCGLVSLWFVFGSVVASIAAAFSAPVYVQIILFCAVSFGCLIGLRPFVHISRTATNTDALLGKTVRITEKVDNALETGKANISGMEWLARAEHPEDTFEVGEYGIVKRVEGAKLILKKEKKKEV